MSPALQAPLANSLRAAATARSTPVSPSAAIGRVWMPVLSAMGLAYGVGFLAVREGITRALTVFNNVWLCVMAGLILATHMCVGVVVGLFGLAGQLRAE